MKLKDKVAIITGVAQGIGAAYARRFAKEGATVVVGGHQRGEGPRRRRVDRAAGDLRAHRHSYHGGMVMLG